MSQENDRGISTTSVWQASCKDCAAEQLSLSRKKRKSAGDAALQFEYSDTSANKSLELGNTRSDRCERHRKAHRQAITALAVPYIDLKVIREVADPNNPSGPLGGLGRLPIVHKRYKRSVDLERFGFGMSDADILAIIDGLVDNRVAVIEAGTGTGKSTFMPFRLMNPPPEARLNLTKLGPIVVTEPRRAAATGVSRFVGEELCFGHNSRTCHQHIGPGYPVGYQVSRDKNWDNACDLIYVTDGTMINWVRDGSLSKIGVVIIDEAHERSENIDIILAQLREKLHEFKHLRVIITSATIDCDFFVSYFGGPEKVFHYSVPEKKTFGYGVPLFIGATINEEVLANGLTIDRATDKDGSSLSFSGWATEGPEDGEPEDLRKHTAKLEKLRCVDQMPFDEWRQSVPKKLAMDLMPSAIAKQVAAIAAGTDWGDILAFLPTRDLILKAVGIIEEQLLERDLHFDVYPLLASEPKNTIDVAIAARDRGDKRKIVVSSNLAETSLTVSGVRYVVDSGLICQSDWDPELAAGSLPTKTHSQSGLRQRWGRVGRDGPGWVFPLYTSEQFLSFPVDTPPGSTRINLEAFSMKLIAAGIDLERTPLPAGFVPESTTPDSDAQKNITNFNSELKRARATLARMGATDSDGHLTEFGRDLDRFSGDGTHGLALMLADQLACVHEVAFALEVIASGILVGQRDDCILQIDRTWPSAWRVAAAQAHRGLALGCEDDFELLLRILSHWQQSDTPDEWCRTWWINIAGLRRAEVAVKDTVKSLSAAVKTVAWRDVELSLLDRARAVLTRALSSHQFENVGDNQFRLSGVEDAEIVELSRSRLVQPGPNFMALQRYRLPAKNSEVVPPPKISHSINCIPWVDTNEPGGDDLGLKMAIKSALNLRDKTGNLKTPKDPLRMVRELLPIGSVVDLKLGKKTNGTHPVEGSNLIYQPFPMPILGKKGDNNTADDDSNEFDIWHRSEAVISDEELVLQVQDPRRNEINDIKHSKQDETADPTSQQTEFALPSLFTEPLFETTDLDPECRAIVSGYKLVDENNVVLLIEPMANDFVNGDPARPADIIHGQDLKLVVRGKVADHEFEFVQFDRADGLGRFFLDANRGGGLSLFDNDYLARLTEGADIEGRVVVRNDDPVSISLRPWAKALLGSNVSANLKSDGLAVPYFEATIIKQAGENGYVTVEIQHSEIADGHGQRFEVKESSIERHPFIKNELGQSFLVALESDRHRKRNKLFGKITEKALKFASQNNSGLFVSDGNILPPKTELPFSTIKRLLKIHGDTDWEKCVWKFYDDSLCVHVSDVRPAATKMEMTTNNVVSSLLNSRGNDVSQVLNVRLKLGADGTVKISDLDPEAVKLAQTELIRLSKLKHMTIELPAESSRLNFETLTQIESSAAISWIWKDGDQITVLGKTGAAVKTAVAQIGNATSPVSGELIVPAGKNGVLIGKGGGHITPLKEATGCWAHNPGDGNLWVIEGPSVAAVSEFIKLAKALMERKQVTGTTGRVVKSTEPIVIRDGTRAATTKPTKLEESAMKPAPKRSASATPTRKTVTQKPSAEIPPIEKPSAEKVEKKPSVLSRFLRLFD